MNIFVLNSGSSSIKFSLFTVKEEAAEPSLLLDGELSGIGTQKAFLAILQNEHPKLTRTVESTGTTADAMANIFEALHIADIGTIGAVGYRVVHPGAEIHDHVRLTVKILSQLETAASFAPLHDPEALTIIRETMERLPDIPHFACFDTVFHQTMPEEASTFAIPEHYRKRGARRYGFHGLSCESILHQMRQAMPVPARMVIAHLGSGCSVTAVLNGRSVDTTMGLTPSGGVVMGTRPGDLDPGLILYLLRQHNDSDAMKYVEQMLNHDAGMVALTGLPNNMKLIREAAAKGNEAALLGLNIFTRSVRKAIGGFAWLMGGLDAIAFTGGIGENDAATRVEILSGTDVLLASSTNELQPGGMHRISASDSKTAVFAAPAKEDLVIALHVQRMVQANA